MEIIYPGYIFYCLIDLEFYISFLQREAFDVTSTFVKCRYLYPMCTCKFAYYNVLLYIFKGYHVFSSNVSLHRNS